jgi:hypothetical protein
MCGRRTSMVTSPDPGAKSFFSTSSTTTLAIFNISRAPFPTSVVLLEDQSLKKVKRFLDKTSGGFTSLLLAHSWAFRCIDETCIWRATIQNSQQKNLNGMSGRRLTLWVGASSIAILGLLRWQARKRARISAEQSEKMVADGPLVSATHNGTTT